MARRFAPRLAVRRLPVGKPEPGRLTLRPSWPTLGSSLVWQGSRVLRTDPRIFSSGHPALQKKWHPCHLANSLVAASMLLPTVNFSTPRSNTTQRHSPTTTTLDALRPLDGRPATRAAAIRPPSPSPTPAGFDPRPSGGSSDPPPERPARPR